MEFDPPLVEAVILKRYKRFLADVRLASGEIITVHCPNTGSMKHCVVAETPCWFSLSDNPKRKLPGTLELTTTTLGFIAGVNTARPNQLVREAIESEAVKELRGYDRMRSEVKYGDENSRIDLLLENDRQQCFVEVKNVTLENSGGLISFPDAVTSRGAKHLRELMAMVAQGHRAVLFFCVQHSGAQQVTVAADIDPLYAETLKQALAAGVEVLAYGCRLSPTEIAVTRRLDFILPL
ncbi:MAG: DNA/RNA nuclease SfsA [Porticoccaceae bacterium]|nr:DNA/RNA nuclease SfsA [Porticoccaceae bacterium]